MPDLPLTHNLHATPHRFLWHAPTRTAILSDLHLGLEDQLANAGLYLPDLTTPWLQPAWNSLLAYHPAHIIIAGDLFDSPNPSPRAIALARNLLAQLPKETLLTLTPGNHDPPPTTLSELLQSPPAYIHSLPLPPNPNQNQNQNPNLNPHPTPHTPPSTPPQSTPHTPPHSTPNTPLNPPPSPPQKITISPLATLTSPPNSPRITILHGHDLTPLTTLPTPPDLLICGHQHPALTLATSTQSAKMICYALATLPHPPRVPPHNPRQLLLLPAFSPSTLGNNLANPRHWLLPIPRPNPHATQIFGIIPPGTSPPTPPQILPFGPLSNL